MCSVTQRERHRWAGRDYYLSHRPGGRAQSKLYGEWPQRLGLRSEKAAWLSEVAPIGTRKKGWIEPLRL